MKPKILHFLREYNNYSAQCFEFSGVLALKGYAQDLSFFMIINQKSQLKKSSLSVLGALIMAVGVPLRKMLFKIVERWKLIFMIQ
jgi:hypothetical protein